MTNGVRVYRQGPNFGWGPILLEKDIGSTQRDNLLRREGREPTWESITSTGTLFSSSSFVSKGPKDVLGLDDK